MIGARAGGLWNTLHSGPSGKIATMLEGSCDCGAVRIELDTTPTEVTDCNCGICRRCGARWSYFDPAGVRIEGATTIYKRGQRILEFHFCPTCGCTTHWAPADKRHPRMGVNMRLFDPELLASLKPDFCDGASW
jgi:hypothetical protein